MKHTIKDYIQPIMHDTYFRTLSIVFVCLAIICIVTVLIGIRPTELQVVTHYTAFGVTNFYRDKWYYLIAFVVFSFLFTVTHLSLACKLYAEKGRMLAVGFIWLSIALLIIIWFIVRSLMNVANLI